MGTGDEQGFGSCPYVQFVWYIELVYRVCMAISCEGGFHSLEWNQQMNVQKAKHMM